MRAANSKTMSIIFDTNDQNIIDQLRDSISFNEFGDIRSILDEIKPKPNLTDILVIVNHLEFYTGAKFEWSPIDGWSYVE